MGKGLRASRLVFFFAVSLLMTSCIGDLRGVKEIDWGISPEFALPVAKAELFLAETFQPGEDSSLYMFADEKGLLHISIEENLDTLDINTLLFDAVEKMEVLNDSIILPRVPKGISIESPATYFSMYLDSFAFEQQIDSLLLNNGTLEFDFKTWENYNSEFSVTLPNLSDAEGNNIRFLNFKPTAANHKVVLNLRESRLKVNTSGDSKGVFTINLGYKITGKTSGPRTPEPVIAVRMNNIDIHAAYGKMRNYPFDMEPFSMDLPVIDLIEDGAFELDLAEPHINLLFLNQFGFPFRFDFTRLGVVKNRQFLPLTGIQKSVFIDSPPLDHQNSFTTNLLKIEPWSNIDQLISKFPERVLIEGTIVVNPYDPDAYNYIREQDQLIIRLEADIPLQLSLSRVSIRSTSVVDFSRLGDLEEHLAMAGLRIKATNQFPLDMNLQAFFTDGSGVIVDSLFVKPALVKAAGSPGVPAETVFMVDKSDVQISRLKNAVNMVSKASFNTTGNGSALVNFNASQSLRVEITGFTRINL